MMPDEDEYETVYQGGIAFRRKKEVENRSVIGGPQERETAKIRAVEEARIKAAAEREKARVAAETNALELVSVTERELQSKLQSGDPHLRTASNQLVYIADILENYRKLRDLLDILAAGELWPCILTQGKDTRPFSAPLDIPPTLAAILVAELRKVSTGELPFPSAPAMAAQSAVGGRQQPYFFGPAQKLIGLPPENAEAGFVYGAKLDADIRTPFSPPEPLDPTEEPPQARVAVWTSRPNLTVVYTHGYFTSTLKQLGVSNPASGNIAYGLYRVGIEVKGFQWFQESLVSVPEQLKVSLDLVPKD